MSKIAPLVLFGLAFVVGGMYWSLWNDSWDAFDNIVIKDSYYELINFGWRMIPAVILIIGIMCLISAGILSRRGREEIY